MCYLGVVALKQALACISCKLRIPCSRTKKANRMKYISDIDVLSFTFRRGLNLIKKSGTILANVGLRDSCCRNQLSRCEPTLPGRLKKLRLAIYYP